MMLPPKMPSFEPFEPLSPQLEPIGLESGNEPVDTAVVLGSGLGDVATRLMPNPEQIIPYAEVTGMPQPLGVPGHARHLHLGRIGGRRVAIFLGRFHLYQGLHPSDVVAPIRSASRLGARRMILTNASGAVDESLTPGQLLLITDHLNLTGTSPLPLDRKTPDFASMIDAYDPELRRRCQETAHRLGISLIEGIYAGVRGPQYETPAEVVALRRQGAHVVGMSTVLETIAARALRLDVLGISLITNRAGAPGGHLEVLSTARIGSEQLARLLAGVLGA